MAERAYPIRPRPDDDPRFDFGLVLDVRRVLTDHGYPLVEHGLDIVDLQQALFGFLYGDRKHEASDSTRTSDLPPRGGHRESCAYAAGISCRCTCHLGEFVVCANRPCVRGEWSAKAAERGWEKQADGSWLDPQCAANSEDRLDYLTAIGRELGAQGGEPT